MSSVIEKRTYTTSEAQRACVKRYKEANKGLIAMRMGLYYDRNRKRELARSRKNKAVARSKKMHLRMLALIDSSALELDALIAKEEEEDKEEAKEVRIWI